MCNLTAAGGGMTLSSAVISLLAMMNHREGLFVIGQVKLRAEGSLFFFTYFLTTFDQEIADPLDN